MERGGRRDKKKEEFLGKSREGDGKEKEAKEDKERERTEEEKARK